MTASNKCAKEHQKPNYLYQLAKNTDAAGRELAKKFYFHSLCVAIDSGKLSVSMIRYSFDVFLADSDLAAKAMQEWLKTTIGITTTASSALALITFSILANHWKTENSNLFKHYVAITWPYVRDSMKGFRNTYRGVSSYLTLLHLLNIQDLRQLTVPLALVLGGSSVLNRIWFRHMSERRQTILAEHKSLLADIQAMTVPTSEQIAAIRIKRNVEYGQMNIPALLSSACSGVIDGLNPYIGALTMLTLTQSMLMFITAFCAIYFLTYLTMRIYEEINLQRQLKNLQTEIEVTLCQKEINVILSKLVGAKEVPENLRNQLHQKRNFLIQNAQSLKKPEIPPFFTGIKNGLAAYKYIMLTISTFLFLSPIKFKPLSPTNRALLGTTALTTFLTHAFITSYKCQTKQEKNSSQTHKKKTARGKPTSPVRNTHAFWSTKIHHSQRYGKCTNKERLFLIHQQRPGHPI